ncbi:MAG: TetR/AcrR family transcriptional regulator [Bacteroidales bacterium]|nr:TetR/AcrR family transcriptional regulator [Bacteroidales bacterium]
MRTENPKQISIVNKGKELFWKYGIRRVSIEEICREAGVSKMTFYKYFKNKNSLVIYIFENLSKDQIKVYREFWESDIPMEEKVQRTIRMKLDSTDHVSMDLVLDIYKSGDQELQDYFNQRTQEMLDIVRYDYREAQDKGLLRQDFSIDFIMYLMNHLGEMISDEKLTSLYSDSSSLLRDLLEFFYYGIMPKSNNKVS